MATLLDAVHGTAHQSVLHTINDIYTHAAHSLAERRQRAQVRRELEAATDRDLRDIGMTRSDIDAVVAGNYHR